MAKQTKIATPRVARVQTTEQEPQENEAVMRSRGGILTIPGIRSEIITTLIIGTAPLITHKFSEKMRRKILAAHMGEASDGREPKDPVANFEAARYRLTDGSDGIPAGGIKACIVDGTGKDTGIATTKAKGAFRVAADDPSSNLCRILTPNPPTMREDVVRNDSGVVDIRHRPQYFPWCCLLKVQYLPQYASLKRVLQAIQMAGFRVGLCEWRPSSPKSKSGSFGTFRIASAEEAEAFEAGTLWEVLARQQDAFDEREAA